MDTREANPGELGGPVASGLELRDAGGTMVIKDMDDKTHQVLAEFPHETVDSYKTVFGSRAFEDGFKERLPVMCWQHDLKDPIGRAISAQVTPRVNEVRGQFSDLDSVPSAKRAYSQLSDGTLTDFSYGFRNARFERADSMGRGVRRITNAFMAEFSPVTIGSIPGAKLTGIREDGAPMPEYELDEIIKLRESGILTVEGAAVLIQRDYPSLAEHIVITEVRDTGDANDNTGKKGLDDNGDGVEGDGLDDGDVDDGDDPVWEAQDAGLHTATGPSGEGMAVMPAGEGIDSSEPQPHVWVVVHGDTGETLDSGTEDDADAAKEAAGKSVSPSRSTFDLSAGVDANMVRAAIEAAYPEMGEILRDADISLAPLADGAGTRSDEYTTTLAASLDATLDSAVQELDGVDMATLPENVQQAVTLVRAADTAMDMLLDVMGIADETQEELATREEEEDLATRAADLGWSSKPWSDFSQADYTPEQWRSACLIQGEGEDKEGSSFPVKEPDGTYNVNAISAAASRINQSDAPEGQRAEAAKSLMDLYGKMKKPVPPNVLKVAGTREEPAEDIVPAEEIDAAMARLSARIPVSA